MATRNVSSKGFLVGAAIGGVLGTVSALLMAPKAGRQLREDLHDLYCDVSDKSHDLACNLTETGKTLAKTFGYRVDEDWTDKARHVVGDVAEWFQSQGNHTTRDLVLGSLAGGVIGTIAGLLVAPKAGNQLREDIAEVSEDFADHVSKRGKSMAKNVRSQTHDWLDLAKDLINNIADTVEDVQENVVSKGKKVRRQAQSRVNDVVELASMGFRLWQNMKKGR